MTIGNGWLWPLLCWAQSLAQHWAHCSFFLLGCEMAKYEVVIRAKITKKFTVDAVDEDAAMAEANEMFSVQSDEHKEKYEQFVLNIVEVNDGRG